MRLVELQAVLTLARAGSFTAAARELGVSPTTLGKTIAALEDRLGVRLFTRTTRSVAITAAGSTLVAELTPALAAIDGALAHARTQSRALAGSLRINSSLHGARQIVPYVASFLTQHPEVTVELATERKMIDIVRAGFDAGIRTRDAVPKDMVRVPLGGAIAFVIVGSPDYLRAHGTPASIRQLADHRCVRYRSPVNESRWELVSGRRDVMVAVDGPLVVDALPVAYEAARCGVGLVMLPRWVVAPDLERGDLVQVLADATPASPPLCLYYPAGRNPPPVLRAFAQHLRRAQT